MPSVDKYAESVHYSIGFVHIMHLNTLRRYLKTTPTDQLIGEIKAIKNPDHLRSLWEAGLKQPLQDVVLAKLEELS